MPSRVGSGRCSSASTLIAAIVSTESPITVGRDSTVAATVTGASIRMAKGFCKPPVRNSRTPNCSVSKAR